MSAWTGTRVPAKTGVPLRMSGDDVTIGCAMGFTLLSSGPRAQGRLEAANARGQQPGRATRAPVCCTAQLNRRLRPCSPPRSRQRATTLALQPMEDADPVLGEPGRVANLRTRNAPLTVPLPDTVDRLEVCDRNRLDGLRSWGAHLNVARRDPRTGK